MYGCVAIGTAGSNALRTSNGTRFVTPTTRSVSVPENIVYPSGAALPAISVATTVPPPVLLSTITDCPQRSFNIWATERHIRSRPPPGTDDVISLTGRAG